MSGGSITLCQICQTVALHGKQTVCSGRCRIKRSRQRKAEVHAYQLRRIQEALNEALRLIGDSREPGDGAA